ncbi:tripartite tricarboxylate transporter TctB family protein [Ochrobactrum sp. WV_118_8]|jgi:hypothetical protein|nr:tripartite tricarboxylate transporter TctB family protein [Brucella intermedia]
MGLFDKKGAGVTPALLAPDPKDPDTPQGQADGELQVSAPLFDVLICGALLALGLSFVVGAMGMPSSEAAFDPGTFPMIAGSLLMLLSAIQIGLTLVGRGTPGKVVFQRPVWLALGMVLIVAFPFAVEAFGYYIVALIWVPVFGVVAGIRKPLPLVITTAVVLLLAKGVFEMLLGTPLP